jgi:hypothetical protein
MMEIAAIRSAGAPGPGDDEPEEPEPQPGPEPGPEDEPFPDIIIVPGFTVPEEHDRQTPPIPDWTDSNLR